MEPITSMQQMLLATRQVKVFYKSVKRNHDLLFEDISILFHILQYEGDKVLVRDIARDTGFLPYFLSRSIQKLQKKGFLTKERSEVDQRMLYLKVTDEQRQRIQTVVDDCNGLISR